MGEQKKLTGNPARDRMRREKGEKKPANTRFTGFEWRRRWDSNPRTLADQLISSQSRYDHFDTSPYLSQHQHLRKRGELMGRTSKNIKLKIPEKPRKIKGFRNGGYRIATMISSVAPSTSRTTLRIYFYPCFLSQKLLKNSLGRKQERRQKIFDFEIFDVEEHQGESGGRNSQLLPKFRVSPVMTTSIRLRIYANHFA